jgi:hypothetical protein
VSYQIQDVPGFEGKFAVEPTCGAGQNDEFCSRIAAMTQRYTAAIKNTGDDWDLQRITARAESLKELRALAEDVAADRLQPSSGVRMSYVIQGRWEHALKQINSTAFSVQEIDIFGEVADRTEHVSHDLSIMVSDRYVPPEKLSFKVEVDRTMMVIKVILPVNPAGDLSPLVDGQPGTLLKRIYARLVERPIYYLRRIRETARVATRFRRSDYIRKAAGIARVGLQAENPSLTSLAIQSLSAFREEIVSLEAGRVKNRYLWRLGWRCLVAAAASASVYLIINLECPVDYRNLSIPVDCPVFPTLSRYRNFFLLIAGTAMGTWISFSLRRVIISFLDLAALEEDRLDPSMRVLFIIGLATVVGLLFWTKAVTVGIGEFQSDFSSSGSYALLIGLLLGIAERTMATAVSKRAGDFAGAIAGK